MPSSVHYSESDVEGLGLPLGAQEVAGWQIGGYDGPYRGTVIIAAIGLSASPTLPYTPGRDIEM